MKKIHIFLVLAAISAAFAVCIFYHQKKASHFADPENTLLSFREAAEQIILELDMETTPLCIQSSNNSQFAGYILSAAHLDTQVIAVVLYSLPAEPEAEFYQFKLSEFIVDEPGPNGAYRESIHEIYTVDRHDGTITTAEKIDFNDTH